MDMVIDFLRMTGCQTRKPLHMLAHGLVMLFNIASRNKRLDRLAQKSLLAGAAAFARANLTALG